MIIGRGTLSDVYSVDNVVATFSSLCCRGTGFSRLAIVFHGHGASRFASAALGGRCNGHGSTLVIPVPGVVRKTCFFSDSRIRRAFALFDLSHRNLFVLRRTGLLAKLALMRGSDVDRHLFHRDSDRLRGIHPHMSCAMS